MIAFLHNFLVDWKFKIIDKEMAIIESLLFQIKNTFKMCDEAVSLNEGRNVIYADIIDSLNESVKTRILNKILLRFKCGFEVQTINLNAYKNTKIDSYLNHHDQYLSIKFKLDEILNNLQVIGKIKDDQTLYYVVFNIYQAMSYVDYELHILKEEVDMLQIKGRG